MGSEAGNRREGTTSPSSPDPRVNSARHADSVSPIRDALFSRGNTEGTREDRNDSDRTTQVAAPTHILPNRAVPHAWNATCNTGDMHPIDRLDASTRSLVNAATLRPFWSALMQMKRERLRACVTAETHAVEPAANERVSVHTVEYRVPSPASPASPARPSHVERPAAREMSMTLRGLGFHRVEAPQGHMSSRTG